MPATVEHTIEGGWESIELDIKWAFEGQQRNMDRAWGMACGLERATGVIFDMTGLDAPVRDSYCCGGGANPGGHEWNCAKLRTWQENS